MNKIPFDFQTLKAFLVICRVGSLSKASEELFLSQPALTRRIQAMEKALGCLLFIRGKRNLELTEKGLMLQKKAEEILNLAERTAQELKIKKKELTGIIRIGLVESRVSHFAADLIMKFKDLHPGIKFEVFTADGDDLKAYVDDNKIDVAFLIEPVEALKYNRIPLQIFDAWGIVFKEGAFPPSLDSLTKEQVLSLPLAVPRRFIVQEDLCEWLGTTEDKLKTVMYSNLASNSLILVEKGFCSLLAIESAFENRPVKGLKFLPIHPMKLSAHVCVKKKNFYLSKAAQGFWEFVEANARN